MKLIGEDAYEVFGRLLSWLEIINENKFRSIPDFSIEHNLYQIRINSNKFNSKELKTNGEILIRLCNSILENPNLGGNATNEYINSLLPENLIYSVYNGEEVYSGPGDEEVAKNNYAVDYHYYLLSLEEFQSDVRYEIIKEIRTIKSYLIKNVFNSSLILSNKKTKTKPHTTFILKNSNDKNDLVIIKNQLLKAGFLSKSDFKLEDWKNLFFGVPVENKINWSSDITTLKCFLKILKDKKIIAYTKLNKIGSICFTVKQQNITEKDLENVKGNEHAQIEQIRGIISNFQSQHSTKNL